MMLRRPLFTGAIVVWAAAAASVGGAATAAYWRHEEGPAGSSIAVGPDTVLDFSGNGNHMRTFDPAFTSGTYSAVVSPLPLRSGLANNFSIDFGPGGDDAGQNDDNYTDSKPINGQTFSAVTIEVAFRMNLVGGYQAVFGKDGKPLGDQVGEPDSPVPPLKFLIRGDDFPNAIPNQLFVEWIDGDGDIHFLAGGETIVANRWYHSAFTVNSSDAALYVANETGPYVLRSALAGQDFGGAGGEVIIAEPLGYSIGRGMFNNSVADWANAHIDEVRISDAVLPPNQFLFVAVPEPATGVAAALGVLTALSRRRTAAVA